MDKLCGKCNKPKKPENLKDMIITRQENVDLVYCNCGRPTDYNEGILKSAREYIESCEDDEIQQTIGMSAKGTELFKNKIIVNLPTIEGLALYLKISVKTLYTWEKEYPEFLQVMGELRQKQANALISKGLSGDYNPTIAKVLLTKHGYREGIDQTTNDKDLPIPIMSFDKTKDE